MTYSSKPKYVPVGKQPISFGLVKAITSMRKACFKEEGKSESDYKHRLASKDLVVLGSLINGWRDIV